MPSIRLSYHISHESFMSRLDPRVKLLYIVWVFAMIIVFSDPVFQSIIVLTLVGAAVAGKLPLASVVKAGRFGLYVGLASWILWILFLGGRGTVLAVVGPVTVTDAGVLVGLSAALRITCVLFAFLIVAMTTPNRDIITALHGLRAPVVVAIAVGIALRLIPQLQAEHATIVEAQKSRATEFDKGSLLARFRKHSAYVIPLSLRGLKIVRDLSVALDARAFDPYAKRTFVRQLVLQTTDRAILGVMAVGLVFSVAVRIAGYGGVVAGGVPGFGQ
jgi:energy-coupling factor transport system permease protein